MIIEGLSVIEMLNIHKNIRIPFYQRDYSWEKKQITRLLNDIYNNEKEQYYLGSIIVKKEGDLSLVIIDGQQRISTLLLISKVLNESETKIDKDDYKSLFKYYKFQSENLKDGKILQKILKDKELLQKEKESNYFKNYETIKKYFSDKDCDKFSTQLSKVVMARVVYNEDCDEHKIFEQINYTGKSLTFFDLVKNNLFSKLFKKEDKNTEEFENRLKEFDDLFKEIKDPKDKQQIIRHFLCYEDKNKSLVTNNIDSLYNKYNEIDAEINDVDLLYEKLKKFIIYYKFFISTDDKKNYKKDFEKELYILIESFKTYAILLIDILMHYSEIDEHNKIIYTKEQIDEINRCFKILEAYKIRRYFCGKSDKEITRFTPTLVNKCNYLENNLYYLSLLQHLYIEANKKLKNNGYRMPTKDELKKAIMEKNIYEDNKFCKNLLVRIETLKCGESNEIKGFSSAQIEHIMPQTIKKWIDEDDGFNYDDDMYKNKLHVIGNLTLVTQKVNNDLSNNIFETKKEQLVDKSNLKLNREISEYQNWDYETIDHRTNELLKFINDTWDIEEMIPGDENEVNSLKPNDTNAETIKENNLEEKKNILLQNLFDNNSNKIDYYNKYIKEYIEFIFNNNTENEIEKDIQSKQTWALEEPIKREKQLTMIQELIESNTYKGEIKNLLILNEKLINSNLTTYNIKEYIENIKKNKVFKIINACSANGSISAFLNKYGDK